MATNSDTASRPRPTADERNARFAELKRRAAARGLWLGLGWTGICCALEFIGWGGSPVLRVMVIGLIAFLVLAAVSGSLSLEHHRYRDAAELLFRSLFWTVVTFLTSLPLTAIPRHFARERIRERAEPLIAAIRAYESHHGEAPPKLAALVPEFIPALPGTGSFDAPDFRYFIHQPRPGHSPTWELQADFGTLFLGHALSYEPSGENGSWREVR